MLEKKRWNEIPGPKGVQEIVNECKYIIAARPDKPFGHVALIMPSQKKEDDKGFYSTTWQCWVPMAMDTGKGRRWSYKGLSYSWRGEVKNEIKYFLYKGLINK
jgi:hypothetical protein